jgi:hypothetical protein
MKVQKTKKGVVIRASVPQAVLLMQCVAKVMGENGRRLESFQAMSEGPGGLSCYEDEMRTATLITMVELQDAHRELSNALS